MNKRVYEFLQGICIYMIVLILSSTLAAIVMHLLSERMFLEMIPRMGALFGIILALSGAFSMMGTSKGHITLFSKMELTEFEKQEGSFEALQRLISGSLAFIVSLFLL